MITALITFFTHTDARANKSGTNFAFPTISPTPSEQAELTRHKTRSITMTLNKYMKENEPPTNNEHTSPNNMELNTGIELFRAPQLPAILRPISLKTRI
jgi:hypothetical protein